MVLRAEGEQRGTGSCLDVPAREARAPETRDRAERDNCKAPRAAHPEGLPGGQMLLLEESFPWLGIWVQRFPFKEERGGEERR